MVTERDIVQDRDVYIDMGWVQTVQTQQEHFSERKLRIIEGGRDSKEENHM